MLYSFNKFAHEERLPAEAPGGWFLSDIHISAHKI